MSLEGDERPGDWSTSRTTEIVKRIEYLSMKTVAEKFMSSQVPF
jgi:hypothetical protein